MLWRSYMKTCQRDAAALERVQASWLSGLSYMLLKGIVLRIRHGSRVHVWRDYGLILVHLDSIPSSFILWICLIIIPLFRIHCSLADTVKYYALDCLGDSLYSFVNICGEVAGLEEIESHKDIHSSQWVWESRRIQEGMYVDARVTTREAEDDPASPASV